MNQEHAWCMAIEKLTGTTIPRRASLIRVLFSEIGRIPETTCWADHRCAGRAR